MQGLPGSWSREFRMLGIWSSVICNLKLVPLRM